MAKGGKLISDSFQISLETQVGLQISAICDYQVDGYIEITFENLNTASSTVVSIAEIPPNSNTCSAGFTMRLKPGKYKWTSRFKTTSSLLKPKQEGEIHICDELHGEIEYGRVGIIGNGAYGNSFFIFNGLGTVPIYLTSRVNSSNPYKGILKIKNLSDNSEISTPQILTTLHNSQELRTELSGISIRPYDLYRASFETEFDNLNTVFHHSMYLK
jgi:hypothetical protein